VIVLGLAGLALFLSGAGQAHAEPIIFGSAFNGPNGPASLYTINPSTGAATLVGPIGFNRVGALDFNPVNGLLYGVGADRSGNAALLTINTATGAGTEVGALGIGVSQDIAFRPSDGKLFSYNGGSIFTINTTTGAATFLLNDPAGFPLGNALAFSHDGTLFTADQVDLRIVDQTSGGTITHLVDLNYPVSGSRANGMKFDFSTDTLFASVIGNSGNFLATIDTGSGDVTEIGPTVGGLDAIAIQPAAAIVPEPSSLALFALGGLALAGWRGWKGRRQAA
jgi:hypothetical protein